MLYDYKDGKLRDVKPTKFRNEKELQTFVENNMKELLGLRFLASEYVIDEHNRVDSVAFDEDSMSFVLIEDKNVKDKGLVDQGFAYLAALFDRKEKFVLLYNNTYKVLKTEKDFDWSQTKIIFISPHFNDHQIGSTSFQDLPFYLYRLEKYGSIVSFERVDEKKKTLTYKNKFKTGQSGASSVLDEVRTYVEEDQIPESSFLHPLYVTFRDRIKELDEVDIIPMKTCISYKVRGQRFASVDSLKSAFRIQINDPEGGIDDPYALCHDIRTRAWGRLVWEIKVNEKTDLDKVILLVKQSYEDAKNRFLLIWSAFIPYM